jgi:hypothetical protein
LESEWDEEELRRAQLAAAADQAVSGGSSVDDTLPPLDGLTTPAVSRVGEVV